MIFSTSVTVTPFDGPMNQNNGDKSSIKEKLIDLLRKSEEARSTVPNKTIIGNIINYLTTTESSTKFQEIDKVVESTTKEKEIFKNENDLISSKLNDNLPLDEIDLNFERQKLHFLMTLPVETTKSTSIQTTKGIFSK